MDSPTSNLNSNQTGLGYNIYVVSEETEEIIQYYAPDSNTTFEGVIDNLKKLGKPSNLFYYNGNMTRISPTDKISSYLPIRQSQVIFLATSNRPYFPVVQPKGNNMLVLMITSEFKMLAFDSSGSTGINQLTSDYGSLVRLSNGNQTKIIGGTLSENLPIRSNQIVFLLEEKIITPQLSHDSIINIIRTENIPMAGPTTYTTRKTETLGNKVAILMESNNQNPTIKQYIAVTNMTSTGSGTRQYFASDSDPGFIPKLPRNTKISKTFPIAYITEDQYKAALKMMGLTTYYP